MVDFAKLSKSIAAARAARQLAEEHFELMVGDAANLDDKDRETYVEKLTELLHDAGLLKPPAPPATDTTVTPMTEAEAREFSQHVMAFGRCINDRLKHVPVSYLDWLNKQDSNRFAVNLRRYLASGYAEAIYDGAGGDDDDFDYDEDADESDLPF